MLSRQLFATAASTALRVAPKPSQSQTVPAGAPENIGTVQGSAPGSPTASTVPSTAAQFAPSRPSLDQLQPTSVIGPEQLQKFTIPTEDYNDIVALSPSAMDISPAGPGLQQDFGQSIRGLQYTEFSVLFDGLQLQPSPGNLSPQPAVYFIEHDIDSITVNRYANAGGAYFQGVEVEGTAKLGYGFALYANGTLNDSAYNSNRNTLAQTPRRTGALGLLYDKANVLRANDDLHGEWIAKNVGPQYGQDTNAVGKYDQYPIKSYNSVSLDAGYQLPVYGRRLSFDVQVFNLFNEQSLIGFAATSVGTPTIPPYWVEPGRSIFFSVSARI